MTTSAPTKLASGDLQDELDRLAYAIATEEKLTDEPERLQALLAYAGSSYGPGYSAPTAAPLVDPVAVRYDDHGQPIAPPVDPTPDTTVPQAPDAPSTTTTPAAPDADQPGAAPTSPAGAGDPSSAGTDTGTPAGEAAPSSSDPAAPAVISA